MSRVLVLGGTAWFGRTLAARARSAGHDVTCLARGNAATPPDGVSFVRADRDRPGAYLEVIDREWDLVVEISWQPGMVREAAELLAERAAGWVLISSASVYAEHDEAGVDEDAALLPPVADEHPDPDDYGGAKVACEQLTARLTGGRAALLRAGLIGGRAALLRAGLIGGDGDVSDRTGYWPGRCLLAGGGPVLVPADQTGAVQIIDVRDLADFALHVGLTGRSGPVNALGEQTDLATALRLSAELAAQAGGAPVEPVAADDGWLLEHGVAPWSGPASLPLWLPGAEHAGFAARSDRRALAWGLTRRPLAETLAGALAYERRRGLDRPRRAGMTRAQELALVGALR